MRTVTNKWIARVLAVALANPALFVPMAEARDTDIYANFFSTTGATAAIPPNVMLLIDTSDSMNLPEAWKEVDENKTAYDSHMEYLWNDLNMIVDADAGSASEVTSTTDSTGISTAATPAFFTTKMGFWYGANLSDRQALWQAARTSAKQTESIGGVASLPRYQYRNYNDLSWIYWLPAGTAEDDPRLSSQSWNKFRGYIKELGDGAGGTQLRGGPSFVDSNDYRNNNQCGASLTGLTPSTVFAPSTVAKNAGKYTGQQWARWEPYLSLATIGNASYPGSSTTSAALGTPATLYPKGYLDTTNASTGNPATNPVYRDNYKSSDTPVGLNGLPIRVSQAASGSGWDDVKADAGGFILQSIIAAFTSQSSLDAVKGWYGLPATSDADSSSSTDLKDSKFIAWKGNRDLATAPAFGNLTGVPAYYDTTASVCDSSTGPASATCLNKPSGSATANITVTKNAPCNLTGATTETTGSGATVKGGGACTVGTITTSGDTNGSAYPSAADVPNPTVCPTVTTANTSIRAEDYSSCSMKNYQTVTAATTCALNGNLTLTVGACAVSGASSIGVSACAITGATTVNVAPCAWSGQATTSIGNCAWVGRTASYIEGVGWKASGGSCQQSGSTNYCNGVTDNTIYSTQAAALAATASCTNTTISGTYKTGGTCTENGSAASCSISGGTNVPGLGLANQSCSNLIAANDYKYGGSCQESGSPLSCYTASGGTSMTIRGNTQTYNQTCSGNKPNSGTTKNAVGTYTYGGTCAASQNNNACTSGTGTAFTVRGAAYTPTTCTAQYTTGTYNRGGTCTGTSPTCAQATPYSGSTVPGSGYTWYSTKATCTGATTAQGYYKACTGTKKVMPTYPPGGNAVTTTLTADACNVTLGTVNINGTNYPNAVTACSDKTDVNSTCSARYGANCITSCGNATPTSVTGGATSATNNYYRTYNFAAGSEYLVHDCKADDAGSKFMHYAGTTLGTFGSGWNASSSYASSATGGVVTNDARKVDMYSVNYLNWKFGPKGPNGRPIGRKTRLQVAKDALANVLNYANTALDGKSAKIGIMAFNQMEKNDPYDSSGSHLVKAAVKLSFSTGGSTADPEATVRQAMIDSINALKASSATPLSESLYESYLYFKGLAPKFGDNGLGTGYAAVEAKGSTTTSPLYVTAGADVSSSAIAGGKYKSPIEYTCQTNMVIIVSDGAPENDTSANTQILALPDEDTISIKKTTTSEQYELASTGLPYGPVDSAATAASPANYVLLDELAYYMANADARSDLDSSQTVGVSVVQFGVDAPVLKHAAEVAGGSAYSADNESTLSAAIAAAVSDTMQWLPVGTNPPLTFNSVTGASEDLFMPAYTPSTKVAWSGTVKKYRMGVGETQCGDGECGNPVSCTTGNPTVSYGVCGQNIEEYNKNDDIKYKIRNEAVSFWIPTNLPDGGFGTKGGVGQVLIGKGSYTSVPTPATRKLYTYISGSGAPTLLTDAANTLSDANVLVTKSLLGDSAMSDATRLALINFARGSDGSNTSDWREWAHFDSVHSIPVVNEAGSMLYYLTSDGVLHAVDTSNGSELWAFMVEEGLPKIDAFMKNQEGDHLEVADGSPMLVTTAEATPRDLLIFGMRRGGRAYYALDVTNVSSPKFAWKITSAMSDYNELGQAWSTPVRIYLRGQKDGQGTASTSDDRLKPLIAFGGGYDPNQDLDTPSNDTMGRAIFIADAATGNLVRKFSTVVGGAGYSVPSMVLAVDATADTAGTIDRLYVGDMGGNLWRIDVDDRTASNTPSNWSIVRLADLNTKLFWSPTMAAATFDGQSFDAIYVGGGDWQQPNKTTLNGALYMVKDMTLSGVASQGAVYGESDLTDITSWGDIDLTTTAVVTETTTGEVTTANVADLLTTSENVTRTTRRNLLKNSHGWLVQFSGGTKATDQATVLLGVVSLGIWVPSQMSAAEAAASCSVGGYGTDYRVDALTGSKLRSYTTTSGVSDSPTIYSAYGDHSQGPGSSQKAFGIGDGKLAKGNVPGEKEAAPLTPAKYFWYSVPER